MQNPRAVPVVVLAAGYGCLQPGVPKISEPISVRDDRPMVGEVLRRVKAARRLSVDLSPVILVVNNLYYKTITDCVRRCGHGDCQFVVQPDRLGAGDAVKQALPALQKTGCRDFLVVFADMPLWRPGTIGGLVLEHLHEMPALTMATIALDSQVALRRYGRILRDQMGKIIGVVEPVDATEEQLGATTVNPSLYVFNREWFAGNIGRVKPKERGDGFPAEVYLPPLVALAHEQGQRIAEFPLKDPIETLGVNTPAELLAVRRIVDQ